jgi:hypothetical protein
MNHAPQPLRVWQCAAVIAVLIALAWLVWSMLATLCRAGRGLYIVSLVGVICLAGCRSPSVYPIPNFTDPVTHEVPNVIPDH